MAKKDFSNLTAGRIYDQIEQAANPQRIQKSASPEEAARRQAELKTQGKKGCKAARLNVTFTPDHIEYLRVMAGISGQSITQFLHNVIEGHKEAHADLYAQAQSIKNQL